MRPDGAASCRWRDPAALPGRPGHPTTCPVVERPNYSHKRIHPLESDEAAIVTVPSPWPVLHEPPALATRAIHVWRLKLDLAPAQIAALRCVLTVDEQARADRFHADRHRHRFIACRAQVRQLLAGYLRTNVPKESTFVMVPRESRRWARCGALRGSISTSRTRTTWRCAPSLCNVNSESILSIFAKGAITRAWRPAFLHRRNSRRWAPFLPIGEPMLSFAAGPEKRRSSKPWESACPFRSTRSFVVTLAPSEPARVLAFDGSPAAAATWWLEHLEPAPGYVGALAAPGDRREVCRWTFGSSTV